MLFNHCDLTRSRQLSCSARCLTVPGGFVAGDRLRETPR
jgi:hypothetical protein